MQNETLNAIKITTILDRLHSVPEDALMRAFLFRNVGSARRSAILVKVLAAFQNGTWCSRTEYVQGGERGRRQSEDGETRKNINNATLEQEQVLRKAGQWRL